MRFFYRPPLPSHDAISQAADMHIRVEVVGQILMRRGQEHADVRPLHQFAQVEADDLGQGTIEIGRELVSQHEARIGLGQGQG